MEQPLGFVAQREYRKVYHLCKSLYGLKQNPRPWFEKFSQAIEKFDMMKSESKHSIFYKNSKFKLATPVVQESKAKPRHKDLIHRPYMHASNGPLAPTPVNLPASAVAKPAAYTSLGAHGPFPATAAAANASALAGWMANTPASSSVQAAIVTASSLLVPPNQGYISNSSSTNFLVSG